MSRRLVVAAAVTGAGALALCGLAAIGSTVGTDDLTGPSWVGRVDAVSV